MARNRRGQKRAQESSDSSRKPGDGQPSSPFASIVLKEKKEPEKKSEPAVRPKKPGQIVQGYNPSDSFADILYNWEHTGNPYAMPHEKKRGGNEAEEKSRKSFGDILAAWEGRSGKKEEKGAYRRVSPSYSPSKDFGSILAAFEGDDGKPASSGRVRPSGKSEGASAHPAEAASAEPDETGKEADKPTVSLFKKMEDDDEIPSAVSWSVFSGAREIERPEPLQEEEKNAVGKTPDRPRGAGYQASVSFGEILRRYDESRTPVRQQKKIAEPEAGVPEGATVDLFRKMEDDDVIPDNVSWSVFKGPQEIARPAPARQEEREERPQAEEGHRHVPVRKSPSFIREASKPVRSFDEILKEKGDLLSVRRERTISELRLMLPQSTLDLHGMSADEAHSALVSFIRDAQEAGLEKIAVIHGKGLHSEDGLGVLRNVMTGVLEELGCAREYSHAKASHGGSGVTWIILKKTDEGTGEGKQGG